MTDKAWTAILEVGESSIALKAPTVGRFRSALAPGALLMSGDVLGELEVLGRALPVVVPRVAAALQVTDSPERHRWRPVGYGAQLLELREANTSGEGEGLLMGGRSAAAEGLPEGAFAFEAPIEGLFYNAPSPEDPPFVAEGDTVSPGQVVGLVEVMKFFYEIKHEGAQAKVARIEAANATPIDSGDVIMWLVPA